MMKFISQSHKKDERLAPTNFESVTFVTFVTRYLPGVSTRTLGARVYNVYVYIIMYYKIIYYTPPYYIIPHAGKLPKSNK